MYAAPYNPPNYAARAIFETAGDFVTGSAAQYKQDEETKRADLKYQRDLQLIREKVQLELAAKREELTAEIAAEDKRYENRMKRPEVANWVGQQPKESDYIVGVEDESGGHSGTDTKRMSKDTQDWKERGLIASTLAMSKNPTSDDVQKMLTLRQRTRMTLGAETDADLKRAALAIAALDAKPQVDIKDNTRFQPYNADAEDEPTQVGEATIGLREAQARQADAGARENDAQAGKAALGAPSGPKANSPEYRAIERRFNDAARAAENAGKELSALRSKTPPKSEAINPKDRAAETAAWKTEHQQAINDAQRRLSEAIKQRDQLGDEMERVAAGGKRDQGNGGGKKPSAAEAHAEARKVLDQVKARGGDVKAATDAINRKLRDLGLPPVAY